MTIQENKAYIAKGRLDTSLYQGGSKTLINIGDNVFVKQFERNSVEAGYHVIVNEEKHFIMWMDLERVLL
mgnify:CR=1 FL=1